MRGDNTEKVTLLMSPSVGPMPPFVSPARTQVKEEEKEYYILSHDRKRGWEQGGSRETDLSLLLFLVSYVPISPFASINVT